MRWVPLSIALLLCSALVVQAYEDNTLEDDDFAEFEQFESDDDEPMNGETFKIIAFMNFIQSIFDGSQEQNDFVLRLCQIIVNTKNKKCILD